MTTCSTVSTVSGQEGHLSVWERCRLKRDWLSLDRLRRSRANMEALDGESIVRYKGNSFLTCNTFL